MSDEFTVQCPKCGTYYNDLQDVCPYCGEPQPTLAPDITPPEDFLLEQPPEPDDLPAGISGFEPKFSEEPLPPPETGEDGLESQFFENDDIFAVVGDSEPGYDHGQTDDPIDGFEPWDDDGDEFTAENGWTSASMPDDDDTPVLIPAGYDYDPDNDEFLYPGSYTDGDVEEDNPPSDEESEADAIQARSPRRLTFRRVAGGCLTFVVCALLFYSGIGVLAIRSGLQERSQLAYAESQTHFERGQELLDDASIELAIAEFERAVKLNPNFSEARRALREAQRISQAQPTPTSQTRTAAAAAIFSQVEVLIEEENWSEAASLLTQVRDLDPNYRPEQVADMLFVANYNYGLQIAHPDQIEAALSAFETALAERDDPELAKEYEKADLYLKATQTEDDETAIDFLRQIYGADETYMDVPQQLWQRLVEYGNGLARQDEWCDAREQYLEANELQSNDQLDQKIETSNQQCQASTARQTGVDLATPRPQPTKTTVAPRTTMPAPTAAVTATSASTASTAIASSTPGDRGKIYYSAYNQAENRWEILSISAGGGTPALIVPDGTMPAVSPDNKTLLFRSEREDAVGIHAFDFSTGLDIRATLLSQHILPRWGNENVPFIVVAEEPGTGRWQVSKGFADGKSDPIIMTDGRTPDWSPDGRFIAYQGADPAGNNPGIYLLPAAGGEATRLTDHESDRSPAFSPDGRQLAYMSAQNGNWDIYVVSVSGGDPLQVTAARANDGLPTWSPDGATLAYVSDADGSWVIYASSLDGSKLTRITEWDGTNRADWLTAQIDWAP
jgi:tetratricopeptide (TPR) repeat protein